MNAIEIVDQVRAAGAQFAVDGQKLVVQSDHGPLPEDLQQAIRVHKTELLVALGVPLDRAVASILGEMRPNLPRVLQALSDDKLLALVNWSMIAAWEKTVRAAGGSHA